MTVKFWMGCFLLDCEETARKEINFFFPQFDYDEWKALTLKDKQFTQQGG